MEPRSSAVVDALKELAEESGPVGLVVVCSVIALSAQDADELRSDLEEAAALADGAGTRPVSRIGDSGPPLADDAHSRHVEDAQPFVSVLAASAFCPATDRGCPKAASTERVVSGDDVLRRGR
jgi:hypothetical protein